MVIGHWEEWWLRKNGDQWLAVRKNGNQCLVIGNSDEQWLFIGENSEQWLVIGNNSEQWLVEYGVSSTGQTLTSAFKKNKVAKGVFKNRQI